MCIGPESLNSHRDVMEEEMPDDLLRAVLSAAGFSALPAAALTCRRWAEVAREPGVVAAAAVTEGLEGLEGVEGLDGALRLVVRQRCRVDVVRLILASETFEPVHLHIALDRASYFGHAEVVRLLLAAGARVDHTTLLYAASMGRAEVMGALLDETPHIPDSHRANLLEMAAIDGHVETVRLLLERGARADWMGGMPLCVAARYGQTEVARLMLTDGVGPGPGPGVRADIGDSYAFITAAEGGHVETMRLLLANGVRADCRGGLSLTLSAHEGRVEATELLLAHGVRNADALPMAARRGHIEAVRRLLAYGARVTWVSILSAVAGGHFVLAGILVKVLVSDATVGRS